MPQITTLLCTYRRPCLLARALASLAAQSCRDFDVRVFDNASGDQTRDVVSWFQQKGVPIDYHCHLENLGYERNFAFAMSGEMHSPYVHILNDDDWVLARFFEIVLEEFRRVPEAVFVSAHIAQVTTHGEVADIQLAHWSKERFEAGEGAAYILQAGHPELTAMLYKSSWLQESGGFDFANYGNACDVPFHVLAAAKYPMVICPELGGIFSAHAEQESAVQTGQAQPIFGKMFAKLQAASFLKKSDFTAVLRAAASRHIYAHRHRHAASGASREWRGLTALARLTASRPAHAFQAGLGYLDSMRAVFSRAFDSGRARNPNPDYAAATAEITAHADRLSRDYINPCLSAVGLSESPGSPPP